MAKRSQHFCFAHLGLAFIAIPFVVDPAWTVELDALLMILLSVSPAIFPICTGLVGTCWVGACFAGLAVPSQKIFLVLHQPASSARSPHIFASIVGTSPLAVVVLGPGVCGGVVGPYDDPIDLLLTDTALWMLAIVTAIVDLSVVVSVELVPGLLDLALNTALWCLALARVVPAIPFSGNDRKRALGVLPMLVADATYLRTQAAWTGPFDEPSPRIPFGSWIGIFIFGLHGEALLHGNRRR